MSSTGHLPPAEHDGSPSRTEQGMLGRSDEPLEARLHASDALELAQFVQKQAWIEDKIKFLSTLDRIDPLNPLPPSVSPTTAAELQEWWDEHDKIESEVEAYDMGDLNKLKGFAKKASKAHLSPRDADLIEIALTTLLAVDRLLHLLRVRRSRLELLQYRLQWEDEVEIAWQAHKALTLDLSSFLAAVRPPACPRPNPPSPPPPSAPSPSSLPPGSTFLHHSLSPSGPMPIRSDIHVAQIKSALQTLTSSTVPLSAVTLDKLIDISSAPLPDPFLDAQDRLEDAIQTTTDGLGAFLDLMLRQRQDSEELSGRLNRLRDTLEQLRQDVDSKSLPRPMRSVLDDLEERERIATTELRQIEAEQQSLPLPTHRAVIEQAEHNQALVVCLNEDAAAAASTLDSVAARLSTYRAAVEVMERADELEGKMDNAIAELIRFIEEESVLEGRPRLSTEDSLEPSDLEVTFTSLQSTLVSAVSKTLAATPSLLRQASAIVVDLGKTSIDGRVRQEVKDRIACLREAQKSAEAHLRLREEETVALAAGREAALALVAAEDEINAVEATIISTLKRIHWRRDWSPRSTDVDSLLPALDTVLSSPLALVSQIALDKVPALRIQLADRVAFIRSRSDRLTRLEQLAANVRQQAEGTKTFLDEVGAVDDALAALAQDYSHHPADPPSDGLKTITALSDQLDELKATAHRQIYFLSPPTAAASLSESHPDPTSASGAPDNDSLPPLPFDLAAQDDHVRQCVNEAIATASGRLDEVRQLLDNIEHRQRAAVPHFAADPDVIDSDPMSPLPLSRSVGRLSTRPPSASSNWTPSAFGSLQIRQRESTAATSPRPHRRISSSIKPPSTPRSTVPRVFSFHESVNLAASSPQPTSRRKSVAHLTRHRSFDNAPLPLEKRRYKSNPNRKVDIAIGRIVDDLDVQVSIAAAEGAHQDESGMYWIGDRLYFCRILRSKTVLVRVGGGWCDLAVFIAHRFGSAHNGVAISPRISPSTSLESGDPHWISSSTLSASQSSFPLGMSLSSSTSSSLLSASASSSIGRRSLSASHSSLPPIWRP